MKIMDVEAVRLLVPLEHAWQCASFRMTERTVVVVKVHTDEGIIGLGDAYHSHLARPEPVAAIVETVLKPVLIGENPGDIERLFAEMTKTIRHLGSGGLGAIAGVDIALWDILGKVCNAPVHALLGAATPARMEPYVGSQTMGWKDLDKLGELVEEARAYVGQGYRALKLRGGRGLPDQREDVEAFRVLREAFGDSIAIMVDVNNGYTRQGAEIMAKEYERYNIFWMEDPITGTGGKSPREYASLATAITVPVAAGGNLFGTGDLRRLIEAGGVDIVKMDASSGGGISEILKMTHLASVFGMRWAPVTHEPLGMLATLHVMAAATPSLTAGMFVEWDPGWPLEKFLTDPPRFQDGVIALSTKPGLGTDLHEDFVK
jgi:L-alanine-DL-glutamate epimerase-like enolase superfamily enzyme